MIDVLMPKIGLVMQEGEIVCWLKKEGESVKEGEILFQTETEKAAVDIESTATGVLHTILIREGEKVPVGTVVARIGGANEAVEAAEPVASVSDGEETRREKVRATPLAKRIASENGINLQDVPPSRGDGRIDKEDVLRYLETGKARRLSSAPPTSDSPPADSTPMASCSKLQIPEAAEQGRDELGRPYHRRPLSSLKSVMASRMSQSARSVAPCTLTTEVNMSLSSELRERLPFKASYTAIIAAALAQALRKHPDLNARLDEDALVLYDTVNLGIAVDTEEGLLVPSIASAESKSLPQITEELENLSSRARSRTLTPDDLSRGTFTLTNIGMFGVDRFTPVINFPEVAILGVGRIMRVPVEEKSAWMAKPICSLSLTFDHRALDGATAARFLGTAKAYIENPYEWMADR